MAEFEATRRLLTPLQQGAAAGWRMLLLLTAICQYSTSAKAKCYHRAFNRVSSAMAPCSHDDSFGFSPSSYAHTCSTPSSSADRKIIDWELRAGIIAQLSRPLVHARFGPHSDNNFSSAHIDHWVTNVPRTGLPCPRERQL